ncbi:MAG: DoxX family protein [Bacteroidales bacterium]
MKKLFSTTTGFVQINISLLILRLGIGALMLTHGWPKLLRLFEGGEIFFPDPLGIGSLMSLIMASLAEVAGSVLVMLGLATRLAAASLAFTMFVAAFVVHADDPFQRKELGLMYLLVYIVLIITGSGRYSVDRLIRK